MLHLDSDTQQTDLIHPYTCLPFICWYPRDSVRLECRDEVVELAQR